MDINTIIAKKRNGGSKSELTKDEIKYFVGKYTKGEISDVQAAALMSYIYINGLTENEIVEFVKEIGASGDVLDLTKISNDIVDKHSTGGVGDKITLILMPIVSALGLSVAKVSSKGCGIMGGTIDKLCAIPGFNPSISVKEFINNVSKIGLSIVSQDLNLAPAESKFYRLRNEIACKDSVVLIAISMMSLRVATGSNRVVFDLTCGTGSYLKDRKTASRLGKLLVRIGKRLDKKVGYVITAMDEPIGKSIGNNLEIQETVRALNGYMTEDVNEIVMALGSDVQAIALGEKDPDINQARIKEVIKSGKALTKFKQMVAAQGGDVSYIDSIDKFKTSKYSLPVYATNDGFVSEIDCDIVGSIAKFLGVGRTDNPEEIDNTAGIIFEKKVGDEVKVGEIVAHVFSRDEDKALRSSKTLTDAYRISSIPIRTKSKILEVYGM